MGNDLIIAIIGLISTVSSLIIGYFSGRRKSNADAFLTEAGVPMKVQEFYQKALNDLNDRLEHYIKLAEENRKRTQDLEVTIDRLTRILRLHYTNEELNKLLSDEDNK